VSLPPYWVDDLFSFPTPPALAKLIDIAWERAFTDEGEYDDVLLTTWARVYHDLGRSRFAEQLELMRPMYY
jgi:hypothetical protein